MTNLNSHLTTELLLNAGDILYHEGSPPDCCYIVASGEFVFHREHNGKRKEYEKRGAGSTIGELSILTGEPRTVTVEAIVPSCVYRISAKQILHRFNNLDPVMRACIETSTGFVDRLHHEDENSKTGTSLTPKTSSESDELIKLLKLERDILIGIDKNEFHLNYQPIVGLEDGEMLGVEALMRWQHPVMGNVPPDQFIEVAENMGAICKITDFAVMEGCAALKRFRQLGQCRDDFFITINISSHDIDRPEFCDFLLHALDLNDLKPANIKLELTETSLLLTSKQVISTLEKLHNFGLGIAIDDFGTGYSNLAYLKKIPLTALKIDRAFAGDAHSNSVSHSIVKMMLGLGAELGVDVIAEGLETQADVDTMLALGCEIAQGFHFSKPVSEFDLCNMIAPETYNDLMGQCA